MDWTRWRWNIAIAFDQLLNTFGGGDPDETISSRAAKARNKGRAWGCILCRVLDWIDPNHCDKSLEQDEGKNSAV